MVAYIIGCTICHSEKLHGKPCSNCHDRDATEDALWQARRWFVASQLDLCSTERVDVAELERRVDQALRDPPTPSYAGRMLQFR